MKLELVLDSNDPEALAQFWAPALGYRNVGFFDPYVLLLPEEGEDGPRFLLQKVDEEKTVKNRVHFDVQVPDIEAEADRLVALGAKRVDDAPLEEHGSAWVRMADPEGNEFCVCREDC